MKNILIGSRALAYWDPKYKVKPETDWDVISEEPVPGTEWHSLDVLNNKELANVPTYASIDFKGIKLHVMPMEVLALIKRSHLWRDYKFQSHITQYYKYGLNTYFEQLSDHNYKLYKERLQLTHEAFPHNHPKLNIPREEFFNDAVTRIYDHDLLHDLVSYHGIPLYQLMLESDDSVFCSQILWDDFTNVTKCQCIAEEVVVTALERFVIPNNNYPSKLAYIKALDKVCTTMCSGWFRDYAIDHYPEILSMYNQEIFTTTLHKLKKVPTND